MCGKRACLFVALLLWADMAEAQSRPSPSIEQIVSTMILLCVGGGNTQVTSEETMAGADISLRSLDRRGNLSNEFTITKSGAEGLVNGIDNALTQVAAGQADKVRDCLKPVRERLLEMLLPGYSSGPAKSKPQVTLYEGIDFDGNDLSPWMYGHSLSTCTEACQTSPACKAFSFNRQRGACMLKNGFARPTKFGAAISGVMDGRRPPGL